ncbi:type III PLP-dependent enzyme [Streptomyces sp. WY228]|nr:type III PLP-dependent enzyme [Streptomyces sp. WY228]
MDPMTDLARRFGTPLYVYRLDRVRRAAHDLLAALPRGARLYYSLKANPHPAVVRELRGMGLHMEVCSAGELATAVQAGTPAAQCLYTGPGKTPGEIADAIRAGVRLFSAESPTDLRRIADQAAGAGAEAECLVRLNGQAAAGGTGLRMTGRSSQFGTDADTARQAGMFKQQAGARPVGAHLFSATSIADEQSLVAEFESVLRTAVDTFRDAGLQPSVLDLGGGFAAPFAAPGNRPVYRGLRASLEGALDRELPRWRAADPLIAFESGRYLVADCGTLLTSVLDVKRSRGTTYAVLDAGVNVLGGMSGIRRLMTPAMQPEVDGLAEATEEVTLVGPLCTPLDVLARSARLTAPRPGDVLSVPNVGAYGLSASLTGFLGRPGTTEVVLDSSGEVVDVRRMEQVDRYSPPFAPEHG